MPERKDEPAPENSLVDDEYWLRRAGAMIESAATARITASERLTTAVGWLTTVFLVVLTTVIAAKSRRPGDAVFGLIIASVAFLVSAYVCGLIAGTPRYRTFDPRVPAEVELAHGEIVRSSRGWLRVSVGLAVAAAVAVAGAIIGSALQGVDPSEPSVTASVVLDDRASPTVVVNGTVAENATTTIRVTPNGGQPVFGSVTADADGEFTATIVVPMAESYLVRTLWKDKTGRSWAVDIDAAA
jgi:hypothetical protein